MISALLTDAKSFVLALSLLVSLFTPLSSGASDVSKHPAANAAQAQLSAGDFNWRDIVPYLLVATTLPGEQGLKAVLENSKVLRVYLANELRAECNRDHNLCAASSDPPQLQAQVTKRIDEIVQEQFFRRHDSAIVDYSLARQPFPFSEIAAIKSEKHPDAYLILALSDRSYTAADLQAKYGPPYDTDIYQWYSVFKYRLDDPRYTSRAVFEVDPVDGAVIKVAISLKARKPKKH
ncbi:MAG TPA: hypothetical protein VEG68_09300 [Terriglobales bacterium]|nr:hypothetical protein [Terriglobales bacterium]